MSYSYTQIGEYPSGYRYHTLRWSDVSNFAEFRCYLFDHRFNCKDVSEWFRERVARSPGNPNAVIKCARCGAGFVHQDADIGAEGTGSKGQPQVNGHDRSYLIRIRPMLWSEVSNFPKLMCYVNGHTYSREDVWKWELATSSFRRGIDLTATIKCKRCGTIGVHRDSPIA